MRNFCYRVGYPVASLRESMVDRHFMLWRAPRRRDQERERFAALMRKLEEVRVRECPTKRALAAELRTSEDALRNWMTGRALGRREIVAKLKAFVAQHKI